MKKSKKHKKAQKSSFLQWCGFVICMVFVTTFTVFGFMISLKTDIILNSAPDEASLALVGVALANNIGTGQVRADQIPVDLPADVELVQDAILNNDIQGATFFQENFQFLQEFEEILTIDIINYLSLHDDRAGALEAYISQLTEKGEEAQMRATKLQDRSLFYKNTLAGYQSDIKSLQASITDAYNNRESEAIMDGLIRLEETQIQYLDNENNATFDAKLVQEYQALMQSAQTKLTVINANKDALIKGVTVSLPAGINVNQLEELDLFNRQTQ